MKINTLNIKKDFTVESKAVHNGYQVRFTYPVTETATANINPSKFLKGILTLVFSFKSTIQRIALFFC